MKGDERFSIKSLSRGDLSGLGSAGRPGTNRAWPGGLGIPQERCPAHIRANYQQAWRDWNDIKATLALGLQASVASFQQEGIVKRVSDYPCSYRANGGLLAALVRKGWLPIRFSNPSSRKASSVGEALARSTN